ncbi:DUF1036 domain-containing protein [Selenomonadales bacterium OttesenSCG-928-I06]|nr:DUF1036 domain-containing protein [Selenomonadales bacterium OttesenSCG-928-I06]
MFKKIGMIFACFLVAFVMMGAISPQTAEAITIQIKNPYSHTLTAAIVYHDSQVQKWFVRGWFKVTPNSTRTINLDESTKQNKVYIHAHTSEASWGSEMKYIVIKEAFKYEAGKTCPAGTARRQVGFDVWYVENNGFVYWKP